MCSRIWLGSCLAPRRQGPRDLAIATRILSISWHLHKAAHPADGILGTIDAQETYI